VTRVSVQEYADAVRGRYQRARKAEKGRMLDEFCRTTGYHRNAAIRLLKHPPGPQRTRRGRPPRYGLAVRRVVERAWEVSGRLCSKRLAPFLPTVVDALERHGELTVEAAVREQVCQVSAATLDRLLRPVRQRERRLPLSQSAACSAVQAQIPIRTWSEWEGVSPGSVQADLVLHCGESTEGFHLTTLDTVDVATGWVECAAVWGKRQQRVRSAVHQICTRLPVPLAEFHTDNGGEFLNRALHDYCQQHGIRFTRGRPWKKNDQAHVEQKNWSVVRKVVGYQRLETKATYEQLQRLYRVLPLYVNCFQPIRKLVSKERVGAKVTKRYDAARTPYERLLASGVLDEARRAALEALFVSLNPVHLRAEIDAALEALWQAAARGKTTTGQPAHTTKAATACGYVDSSADLPTYPQALRR